MGGQTELYNTKLNYRIRRLLAGHRVEHSVGRLRAEWQSGGVLIVHSHKGSRAARQAFNIRLKIRFRVNIGRVKATFKLALVYIPVTVIKY